MLCVPLGDGRCECIQRAGSDERRAQGFCPLRHSVGERDERCVAPQAQQRAPDVQFHTQVENWFVSCKRLELCAYEVVVGREDFVRVDHGGLAEHDGVVRGPVVAFDERLSGCGWGADCVQGVVCREGRVICEFEHPDVFPDHGGRDGVAARPGDVADEQWSCGEAEGDGEQAEEGAWPRADEPDDARGEQGHDGDAVGAEGEEDEAGTDEQQRDECADP